MAVCVLTFVEITALLPVGKRVVQILRAAGAEVRSDRDYIFPNDLLARKGRLPEAA
jgi:hypothetical protein